MNNSKKYLFIVLLLGIYCLLAEEKELIITSEKEFGIPLTEALMRDHGILNRVLLVYEEIVRRIDQRLDFPQKFFRENRIFSLILVKFRLIFIKTRPAFILSSGDKRMVCV